MNPQVGKMFDADKKPAFGHGDHKEKLIADPGKQESGEAGHVELHRGPSPKDGKGSFHTIHHPSGEVRGHETLHEAHHAMNDHMGQDGCKGDGNCAEHGDGGEPGGDTLEGAALPSGDEL